ncbi:MAG: hypothetical protein SHS37scaffold220_15 [Phage 67_12]|nr:MAG: hypothetical protein SHS37scaffold220_15 [Phage 67_12]
MIHEHDQSGPAFPHFTETGVSVRDFFLAAALQGIAGQTLEFGVSVETAVERASELADEALDQREFPRTYRVELRRAKAHADARVQELEHVLQKLVDACQSANAGLEDDPVNREAYREAVNKAERALEPDIPF